MRTLRGRSRSILLNLVLAATLLTLPGCETVQQNQKAVAGGFLGALATGGTCLLAHGNAALCAALAVVGGGAGALIGHHFDERDRARRQQALALALNTPALWRTMPGPVAAPMAANDNVPSGPVAAAPAYASDAANTVSASAPAARATGGNAWVNPDKQVAWTNPDTSNSGTITPLRSYLNPSGDRVCRQMKETYVRQGAGPVSQNEQACQNPDGSWTLQNG